MKTVWVKHNNFGQLLPMSEWKPFSASDDATHIVHQFDKFMVCSKDLDAGNLNIQRGEILSEYIGDQRGDGWFYVEDGDLPPDNEAVLISDGVDCLYTEISTLTYHNALCWQPMQPPKFIGECDV